MGRICVLLVILLGQAGVPAVWANETVEPKVQSNGTGNDLATKAGAAQKSNLSQLEQVLIDIVETDEYQPVDISRQLKIMLQLGLVAESEFLLNQVDVYERTKKQVDKKPYAGPFYTDLPEAKLFQAKIGLLKHRLGSILTFEEDESTADKVGAAIFQLEGAANQAMSGIRQLEGRQRGDFQENQRADRLKSELQLAAAEIYMAMGDVAYRANPATLIGEAEGDVTLATVKVHYNEANRLIYDAYINASNEKLVLIQAMAEAIESRLGWHEQSLYFGGRRFFQLPPMIGIQGDDAEYTLLNRLKRLTEGEASGLIAANERLVQSKKEASVRTAELFRQYKEDKYREKSYRQSQIREIARQIFDLETEIGKLGSKKKDRLYQHVTSLQGQVLEKFEDDEKLLDDEAVRLRDELELANADLAGALQALNEVAAKSHLESLAGFKGRTDRLFSNLKIVSNQSEQTLDSLERLFQFRPNNFKDLKQEGRNRFEALKASLERTRDGIKSLENNDIGPLLDEAKLRVENAGLAVKNLEGKVKEKVAIIESMTKELVEKDLEDSRKEIESGIISLEESALQKILESKEDAAKLADRMVLIGKDELNRRKQQIQQRINLAKRHISEAEKFVDDLKASADQIQKVFTSAKTAILAAANVPSGIVSGTSCGVFTQRPTALMKAAESGIQLVQEVRNAKITIENAKQRFQRLKQILSEYESQISQIDMDLIKTELKDSIERIQSQGEREVDQFKKRILARKQALIDQARELILVQKEKYGAKINAVIAAKESLEVEIDQAKLQVQQAVGLRSRYEQRARFLSGDVQQKTARVMTLHQDLLALAKLREVRVARKDERFKDLAEERQRIELDYKGQETRLRQRITELQGKIESLKKKPTEVQMPIAELVSIASGPSLEYSARNYFKILDEANNLLFDYANWLYLVSGDPAALRWAIACQTPEEVLQVKGRLNRIRDLIVQTLGSGRVQLFGVRLSREMIEKYWLEGSGQGELIFNVAPHMGGLGSQKPVFETVTLKNELPIEVGVVGPLDYSDEVIFAPNVDLQRGLPEVLIDAWVVPQWRQAKRFPIERRGIGLEAVGPTSIRVNGVLKEVPIMTGYVQSGRWQSFGWAHEARVSTVSELSRSAWQLKQEKAVDIIGENRNYQPNNPMVLYRGVTNRWRLVMPSQYIRRSRQGGADLPTPALADLESITIYFSSIVAGRSLRTGFEKKSFDPNASLAIDPPELIGDISYSDEFVAEMKAGPAGRLQRLGLLKQIKADLDDGIESPLEMGRRLDRLEGMQSKPGELKQESVNGPDAVVRQITGKIIEEEVFGSVSNDSQHSTVPLKSTWLGMQERMIGKELRGSKGEIEPVEGSLLYELKFRKEGVEYSVDAMRKVVGKGKVKGALEPLLLVIDRIGHDMNKRMELDIFADALVGSLGKLAKAPELEKTLARYLKRYEMFSQPTAWAVIESTEKLNQLNELRDLKEIRKRLESNLLELK